MFSFQSCLIGFILGVALSVYIWASNSEKKDKTLELNRKVFSSKNLELILETSSKIITNEVQKLKRNLTEEEKDAIIAKCCKDKYCL